ncbi:MAG TPA: ABC transporter permease [Tenuifilaceae bacterium]|nr:ABC transporter permease [Tenuifilaceae bacterium]HOZ15253.1 ABC transporter permease [Tenuifilaceae bacterium]HPI43907.1 ABC transporter permease [Tenuifilaceae bacterium]HPN21981.1 ABC transporter permease [Tenuifilaceae bacterium]
MNTSNLAKIALKAMVRNKMRTFLTMLGIIIGVASVIVMLAIGQGSKKSIQNQISSMGSNMIFVRPNSDMREGVRMDASSMQTLEIADVEAIKKSCPSVSAVSPQVSSGGQVIYSSNNWPTSMQGVNADYLSIRKLSLKDGRIFNEQELNNSSKVCVLGQTVVENLFTNGESPIGKTIRFNKIPFKVIGVLAEKGENTFGQDQDDIIIAPYTTVQKRIMAITWVQSIFTSAVSEEASSKAVDEISEALRKSHKLKSTEADDFEVRSQAELINTFSSITNMLTILLAAIASISLFVGGIGIMNIMFVSVTERTREIGLRMAIGGREVDIMLQFLIESVMISFAGGLIGVMFGFIFAYGVSAIFGWPIAITSFSVILSFIVCLATGVFFGWYPARKASYLDPIEALRYE